MLQNIPYACCIVFEEFNLADIPYNSVMDNAKEQATYLAD